jgi:hypothetical protein
MPVQDVDQIEPPDYRGFVFLTDGHIVDGRHRNRVYQFRHFLVRREFDSKGAGAGAEAHLRLQFVSRAPRAALQCRNDPLHPVLRRMRIASPDEGDQGVSYRYELDLDFSTIPADTPIEVTAEGLFWGDSEGKSAGSRTLPHIVHGDTKVTSMWVLLGEPRPAGQFELIVSHRDQPGGQHAVRPTRYFESIGGRIYGWQIIGPEPDASYEGHWLLE